MATQALQAHNDARREARGGSRPSLIWSNDLALRAQDWANHLAQIGFMQHSQGSGDGENLYSSMGIPNVSFTDAVNAWVGEKVNYNGENIGDGNIGDYGHYTQVIWPETTAVGMGAATGSNGWTYIAGRYSPPGNMLGMSAWRPGPGGPGGPSHPPTSGPAKDGLIFLNGYEGNGHLHTIVGWYANLAPKITSLPEARVESTNIPPWEGSMQHVTFPDGNVVTWNIQSNAQAQANYTKVGTAHNNFRSFDVFRDDHRKVFDLNGIEYRTIYWLQ